MVLCADLRGAIDFVVVERVEVVVDVQLLFDELDLSWLTHFHHGEHDPEVPGHFGKVAILVEEGLIWVEVVPEESLECAEVACEPFAFSERSVLENSLGEGVTNIGADFRSGVLV